MNIRATVLVLCAAIAVCSPACRQRHCVPESIRSKDLIDLSAAPGAHAPMDYRPAQALEAELRQRVAAQSIPGARPYHILALSGGGLYGSFGVGLLSGWTEAGTRPPFDIVTGISTGALMSTFAYLGPEYDGQLRQNMIGVRRADILRRRSFLRIPFADAVFSSRPLARMIDEVVTPQLLHEVARAHASGRRLYVGSTNMDTRDLVIWDMGAIASRSTPESAELYKKVLLASSSIPGAFPPVRISMEIDGRKYDELHADGGIINEVLFRAYMIGDLNRAIGLPGAAAPPGSTLYVVSNGKLYADSTRVRPKVTNMVKETFRSLLYSKSRDELYRIYLNCLETGVEFHLTAVPQNFHLSTVDGLTLSAEDQQRLYESGRQIGTTTAFGEGWWDIPPGTTLSEQAPPRAGTRFVTPASLDVRVPAAP